MVTRYRRIGLQRHGRECWVCGAAETADGDRAHIDVHHMHGKTGPVIAETLIPLCTACHAKVHSDTTHSGRIGKLQTELRAGAPSHAGGPESTGARLSLINDRWVFELTDMKTITLKIPESTRDQLDEEADERGYDSRSAYLREIIDSRHEAEQVREKYQTRLADARAEQDTLKERLEAREKRIDELEEQLRQRRNRIDTIEEEIEDLPARLADEQNQSVPAPFFVRWYQWYRNRNRGG